MLFTLRSEKSVVLEGIFSQLLLLFLSPGRCASCGENVVGEGTGCTAMDQVFHVDCFVCMTCSTKLRGKPFYAVEKKAYCEPCYIVSSFLSFKSTCLNTSLSLTTCVRVLKVHIISSGIAVPGMFHRFHFRQPHFISSKPRGLPPLTTHTFSFPLLYGLRFVFGHSVKLSCVSFPEWTFVLLHN